MIKKGTTLVLVSFLLGFSAFATEVIKEGENSLNQKTGEGLGIKGAVSHQIYAYYRRNTAAIEKIVPRSVEYETTIKEVCDKLGYDFEIAIGVAAQESRFNPKARSGVGAYGLFQIYRIPTPAFNMARKVLGYDPDKRKIKDNIYLGVATLVYYLNEMGGDLLLGLVAYNMGSEGDLVTILETYKATTFLEVQPYLILNRKQDPRIYPIKILAFSLGYRIWKTLGRFPRYEKGNNAQLIQALGIPALSEKSVIVAEATNESKNERIEIKKYPANGKPKTQNSKVFYRVAKGDTLYEISRVFALSVKDLKELNPQISGYTIKINQKIYLPSHFKWHKVKKGESLFSIAKKYKLSLAYLKRWNKKWGRVIHPGEKLIVKK